MSTTKWIWNIPDSIGGIDTETDEIKDTSTTTDVL